LVRDYVWCNVFYFLAIKIGRVAISSALLGTQPLLIILLALFILKEKLTFKTILACSFTLIGISLLIDLNTLSFSGSLARQFLLYVLHCHCH
jgi:uncharacterized membrane protein